MASYSNRFYEILARPLALRARFALVALTLPLLFSFFAPLWRITMEAAQYPHGLELEIYSHTVVGGGENGHHLQEINTLNHYIGMRSLDRESLTDLDWIPFALGALVVFSWRVAAIGNVSALVDLVVMTLYVSAFAFARFVYTLYVFGHELRPDAPMKVPGFMPAVIGEKQIANFTTHSWPALGSWLLAAFVLGIVAVLITQLWPRGRRARQLENAPAAAE